MANHGLRKEFLACGLSLVEYQHYAQQKCNLIQFIIFAVEKISWKHNDFAKCF